MRYWKFEDKENREEDLKMLINTYKRLYEDPVRSTYNCLFLLELMEKAEKELQKLVEINSDSEYNKRR